MDRLEAWYNGDIEDDDLTDAEIRELEKRVHSAVAQKILIRADVHTFPEHKTVQ